MNETERIKKRATYFIPHFVFTQRRRRDNLSLRIESHHFKTHARCAARLYLVFVFEEINACATSLIRNYCCFLVYLAFKRIRGMWGSNKEDNDKE
jgi:hypothetical protein